MASLDGLVEVSAPGKVLICGGYVVLRGGHSLVLSTSSRFHSSLRATSSNASNGKCSFDITVRSPQFGKLWKYSSSWLFAAPPDTCAFSFQDVSPPSSGSNIYVECAALFSLATAAALSSTAKLSNAHYSLELTIQADNDFYSHSKAVRTLLPPHQFPCTTGYKAHSAHQNLFRFYPP